VTWKQLRKLRKGDSSAETHLAAENRNNGENTSINTFESEIWWRRNEKK